MYKAVALIAIMGTSLFGFEVDGLKSGMSFKEMADLKWEKQPNGDYSGLSGTITPRQAILYGDELTGSINGYFNEILGHKALVQVFMSAEDKKRLYALRIIWHQSDWTGDPTKIRQFIQRALEKKYGKSLKETKRAGKDYRGLWEIDKNTVIGWDQKYDYFITYIDPEIQAEHKKALKKKEDKNLSSNGL